jgi:hypothetical protein
MDDEALPERDTLFRPETTGLESATLRVAGRGLLGLDFNDFISGRGGYRSPQSAQRKNS